MADVQEIEHFFAMQQDVADGPVHAVVANGAAAACRRGTCLRFASNGAQAEGELVGQKQAKFT
jgi:hypothetical protein